MTAPTALHGDVDADGQIVDDARRERLRRAIGPYRAADVDATAQLDLTLALLQRLPLADLHPVDPLPRAGAA